jgi:hypothetical protein
MTLSVARSAASEANGRSIIAIYLTRRFGTHSA